MDVEYETDERSGITLVEAVIGNPNASEQTVRVTATGSGVVLPPRVEGYPAPGWDETGYEAEIGGREQLPVGFAVEGTVSDPPVTVEVIDDSTTTEEGRSATSVLQRLGDPRPAESARRPAGRCRPDPSSRGTDACGSVPPVIAAWFDRVATQLDAGDAAAAARVAAVAERAAALRDRTER